MLTNLTAEEVLLRMVERSHKVHQMSDRDLAQMLIDMTEELNISSYQSIIYMEIAERLAPELFDEAEDVVLRERKSDA